MIITIHGSSHNESVSKWFTIKFLIVVFGKSGKIYKRKKIHETNDFIIFFAFGFNKINAKKNNKSLTGLNDLFLTILDLSYTYKN